LLLALWGWVTPIYLLQQQDAIITLKRLWENFRSVVGKRMVDRVYEGINIQESTGLIDAQNSPLEHREIG
jgi:hypothetical protein